MDLRIDFVKDDSVDLLYKLTTILEGYFDDLLSDGRLCGFTGSEILFVYGFRGSYEAVLGQFREYIDSLTSMEFTTEVREQLQIRSDKHIIFESNNPYRKLAMDELRKLNMEKHFEHLRRISEWDIKLHEKKECICFLN